MLLTLSSGEVLQTADNLALDSEHTDAAEVVSGPTIPASQSVSSVADCPAGKPMYVTMPPAWTQALLTFEVSKDGKSFQPLCNSDGAEIAMRVQPNDQLAIPKEWLRGGVKYIKFRSGTSNNPTAQEAHRTFVVKG